MINLLRVYTIINSIFLQRTERKWAKFLSVSLEASKISNSPLQAVGDLYYYPIKFTKPNIYLHKVAMCLLIEYNVYLCNGKITALYKNVLAKTLIIDIICVDSKTRIACQTLCLKSNLKKVNINNTVHRTY